MKLQNILNEWRSPQEEISYLISNKPKLTYRQIVGIAGSQQSVLARAIGKLRLEDKIAKWAETKDPSKFEKLKSEFMRTLDTNELNALFAKRWKDIEPVKKKLFHVLIYWNR